MRIFLSFASEQHAQADAIAQSLRSRDYDVFFSHDDLPPGASFDVRVERAIAQSDLMVFLVSPQSVTKGRYTLTELAFARAKWPNPSGRMLPVMIAATPLDQVPGYLKAVTILAPEGNAAAETRAAVDRILKGATAIFDRSTLELAVLAIASGLLSYLSILLFERVLRFSLFSTPGNGVTAIPGILFGIVVARCSYLFGSRDRFHLALVVGLVAIGWLAAFDSAVITFTTLDEYKKQVAVSPLTSIEPDSTGSKETGESNADDPYKPPEAATTSKASPVVPYLAGLAGGAVGGAITIFAVLIASPGFRKPESCLLVWGIASALGGILLGMLDILGQHPGYIALFTIWQTATVLAIARALRAAVSKA